MIWVESLTNQNILLKKYFKLKKKDIQHIVLE